MAEQYSLVTIFHPAEGRCDIAADLEEERRNAYSAHKVNFSVREHLHTHQQEWEQWLEISTLPPVEGRCDIAADLEEERRNAYSVHRTGTMP
ncbi:MAG TPA: hypothetical protein VFV38_18155 [Ktedonobacteraceae bacterium]|nr:hypothetical protein [Ktedonobacteraceae bacterium]